MQDKILPAIEALHEHLEKQLREVADTKRTINSLLKSMGELPMFDDPEADRLTTGRAIRRDQFYGQPFATAARQYLESRGQAVPAEDIMSGLNQGGFDFNAIGWKEGDRLRILALTLAKNSTTFHRLPNGTIGLLSWYPEVSKKPKAERKQSGSTDSIGAASAPETLEAEAEGAPTTEAQ
jgi:hypothetical protein